MTHPPENLLVLDGLIGKAIERPLTVTDFDGAPELGDLDAALLAFVVRVAERFLGEGLSWEDGDAAMNAVFWLMVHTPPGRPSMPGRSI
jgi:hypothetical protein